MSQSVDKNSKNEKKSVNLPSPGFFSSLSTLGWKRREKCQEGGELNHMVGYTASSMQGSVCWLKLAV